MVEVKTDNTLCAAVDLAREAAVEIAEPGAVGDHLACVMEAERLATHYFACTHAAYGGWRWSVSLARAPRQKVATVCETALVPGPDAILAPEWIPYAARIAPGDLGAGDVLPYRADDPLLQAGFEATGDDEADQLALGELGLGRRRVLSAEGRAAAAERWYSGSHGPHSEIAEKATERCATCGYFLPMAGALRSTFGVCANEWSPSDGQVVSLDHGCGAHSEVDVEHGAAVPVPEPLVDELALDLVDRATVESATEQPIEEQPQQQPEPESAIEEQPEQEPAIEGQPEREPAIEGQPADEPDPQT